MFPVFPSKVAKDRLIINTLTSYIISSEGWNAFSISLCQKNKKVVCKVAELKIYTVWSVDNNNNNNKGNPTATAYNGMLDNSMLLVLWQQFGKGPVLFQHESVH